MKKSNLTFLFIVWFILLSIIAFFLQNFLIREKDELKKEIDIVENEIQEDKAELKKINKQKYWTFLSIRFIIVFLYIFICFHYYFYHYGHGEINSFLLMEMSL